MEHKIPELQDDMTVNQPRTGGDVTPRQGDPLTCFPIPIVLLSGVSFVRSAELSFPVLPYWFPFNIVNGNENVFTL